MAQKRPHGTGRDQLGETRGLGAECSVRDVTTASEVNTRMLQKLMHTIKANRLVASQVIHNQDLISVTHADLD